MISKNKLKLLRSLKLKKYREQNQQTILEGIRLINESMNFDADIENVWGTEEAISSNSKFITKVKTKKINCDIITDNDLKFISDTQHSQGMIAIVNTKKYLNSKVLNINHDHIVVLDNISDPGNLGTIFRTCAWYGIKSILLTSNSVDPFNFKTLRAGMGAHFYFDYLNQDNHQSIIDLLHEKKYDVFCADLKGKNLSKIKVKNRWAIILGSEAHGISKDFDSFQKITISQFGKIESLNVSVATGIILNHLIH